jgi:hypothetical protein
METVYLIHVRTKPSGFWYSVISFKWKWIAIRIAKQIANRRGFDAVEVDDCWTNETVWALSKEQT